ncbi:MAG: 30S ribosomal protein S6 [bacterium]
MKQYELLAIVPGTLSDEETGAVQKTIRDILEKYAAKISKQDVWEKRKLAYPIGQTRQGTYLLCLFDLEPEKIDSLDRALTLEKSILRHIVVLAYHRTANELEQEARRRAAPVHEARSTALPPEEAAKPAISPKELDEKLAEILTDDMVK